MTEVASADELAQAGVGFQNLRMIPVEGTDERVQAFDVDPTTWFDQWQRCRTVIDGRGWPVATSFDLATETITRHDMDGPDGLDPSPAAILARVPQLDIDPLLEAERQRHADDWRPDDDDLDFYLTQSPVAQDLGLTVVDVHRALGPAPDELAFERWLLDTELNHGAGPKSSDAWYLEWFVPPDVTMVLLPRSEPWAAGAYIGGYVWGYPHTDIRTAVLRRWHQRHGAEPAANWGTMLQFVVSRPPTNIEEAWVVAYETKILWPDTAGGANGIATRQHAWDLLGRDRWFVHYRP